MTVTYRVHSATYKGLFKLLFTWRGSVFQMIWKDLIIIMSIHTILECIYVYVLFDDHKIDFTWVSAYCKKYRGVIPLSMVLGLFVSRINSRFFAQFNAIPWPHRIAMLLSTHIHTRRDDDVGLLLRRTVIRYVNLAIVMSLTVVSKSVKRRFPTIHHLTEAGFLLPAEENIMATIKAIPDKSKYVLPLLWSNCIIVLARKQGRIRDNLAVQKMVSEINAIRGSCSGILSYDMFTIPLVYTQIITIAVYMYVYATMIGNINIAVNNQSSHQMYYNWLATLTIFVIYFGWLKVAEETINPFGDDDDDFECNRLVDRYLHESFMIVDELHDIMPELMKDIHWNNVSTYIPYTLASQRFRQNAFFGSTKNLHVPEALHKFVEYNRTGIEKVKKTARQKMTRPQNYEEKMEDFQLTIEPTIEEESPESIRDLTELPP